jgi:hypothetical protein
LAGFSVFPVASSHGSIHPSAILARCFSRMRANSARSLSLGFRAKAAPKCVGNAVAIVRTTFFQGASSERLCRFD